MDNHQTEEAPPRCVACGGVLHDGPLGVQCLRCSFALAALKEEDDLNAVSELFPELIVEEKVADGGFGSVYRAEHRKMKRTVALKFLDDVLARNPDAVALFEQEMISVGGLDHPGIVRAHDAGERDGHWYIIMEFVDGMDCGALVRKHGTLPVAECCEIIRQAALALHHAHRKGVIHRDVKPANVMVSREGAPPATETTDPADAASRTSSAPSMVKILDFGLSGLAVTPVLSQPVDTIGSTLFLGTLEYISPEQIEHPDNVDARADIFSLGATFWRLLTGRTPRQGGVEISLFTHMKQVTSEPVPSLEALRPDLPGPLVQLCDQMLSLDRNCRPASMEAVAQLIEPWCEGAELARLFGDGKLGERPARFPRKPRRLVPVAVAVAAAAALAAGGKLLLPDREKAAPAAPATIALAEILNSYAWGSGRIVSGSLALNIWNDATGAVLTSDNGDAPDLTVSFSTSAGPLGNGWFHYDAGTSRLRANHSFSGPAPSNNPGSRVINTVDFVFAHHLKITNLNADFKSLNTAGVSWEFSRLAARTPSGGFFSEEPDVAAYASHTPAGGSPAKGFFLVDNKDTVLRVGSRLTASGEHAPNENLTGTNGNSFLDYKDLGLEPGTQIGGFQWVTTLEDVRGMRNDDTSLASLLESLKISGSISVP